MNCCYLFSALAQYDESLPGLIWIDEGFPSLPPLASAASRAIEEQIRRDKHKRASCFPAFFIPSPNRIARYVILYWHGRSPTHFVSASLSVCLSLSLSLSLSVSLSLALSVSLSVSLYLSLPPSLIFPLCVSVSFCLCLFLSLCLYLYCVFAVSRKDSFKRRLEVLWGLLSFREFPLCLLLLLAFSSFRV